MFYKTLLRPLLFSLSSDPEVAHNLALRFLHQISKDSGLIHALRQILCPPEKPVEVLGLKFPNPIGLAAGFDKDGVAVPAMTSLGFGFVEVGTVTSIPQMGNPRPRMFRLKQDEALINRMGFNNAGAKQLALQLSQWPKQPVPIGINIGKSKITPEDQVNDDYLKSLELVFPFADYIVVNVSSPNTPGLRKLQEKTALWTLLSQLGKRMRSLATEYTCAPKPLLVKIAPDLSWEQIDDVLEVCFRLSIPGIIATNTTIRRDGLKMPIQEQGGLSGRPVHERAVSIVEYIKRSRPEITVIGVGGISHPDHVKAFLDAGASLVQLYTGFIYEGPGLIKRLVQAL